MHLFPLNLKNHLASDFSIKSITQHNQLQQIGKGPTLQLLPPVSPAMTESHSSEAPLNHSGDSQLSNSNNRRYHPLIKTIICILFASVFLLYRFLMPELDVKCIMDLYQDVTEDLNRSLVLYPERGSAHEGNDNPLSLTGQVVIGMGQVLMDLWIFIIGLLWVVKIKNMRSMAAIIGFFLARAVVYLNVSIFPFPDHFVWRNPGFFSFTVPYDYTRDFFYSGHTGTLTFIFLELLQVRQYFLTILVSISWIFMVNTLLITKVHYMTDIVGAIIFALWLYRSALRVVVIFDKLMSLPHFIMRWIIEHRCKAHPNEQMLNQPLNQDNSRGVSVEDQLRQ